MNEKKEVKNICQEKNSFIIFKKNPNKYPKNILSAKIPLNINNENFEKSINSSKLTFPMTPSTKYIQNPEIQKIKENYLTNSVQKKLNESKNDLTKGKFDDKIREIMKKTDNLMSRSRSTTPIKAKNKDFSIQKTENTSFSKNLEKSLEKIQLEKQNELIDFSDIMNMDSLNYNYSTNIKSKAIKINVTPLKSEKKELTTNILKLNNDQYYEGELYNNKRNGFGILYSSENKILYEGEWKNNYYNGKGRLFNISNTINNIDFSINYKNLDSLGDNWVYYDGEFLNGMKNGIGTIIFRNGKKFDGQFKQGYFHGKGIIYDENMKKEFWGEWRLNIYVSNLF